MVRQLTLALVLTAAVTTANAHPRHRYRHYAGHHGYGVPWCGIYMRTQVGNDPGASYNLARNWAHWGTATTLHPGAIVVWPHHVGKIEAGNCPVGSAMVHSGNDGNAIRTRCVSLRGVIAYRSSGYSSVW